MCQYFYMIFHMDFSYFFSKKKKKRPEKRGKEGVHDGSLQSC